MEWNKLKWILVLLVVLHIVGVCSDQSGVYVPGHHYLYRTVTVPYYGLLANPVVLKSGYLADTQGVAASKRAHVGDIAKYSHDYDYDEVQGRKIGGGDGYTHTDQHTYGQGDLRDHGLLSPPHILREGYFADAHEVTSPKVEHIDTVSKSKIYGEYALGDNGKYAFGYGDYHLYPHHAVTYRVQIPNPLLHGDRVAFKPGQLTENHEVVVTKSEPLASIAKVSHGYGGDYGYGESFRDIHGDGILYSHQKLRHYIPNTFPYALHDGHITDRDTHEVTTKTKHLSRVSKTKPEQRYALKYRADYAPGYGGANAYSHYVPITNTVPVTKHVVFASDHSSDTHQVPLTKGVHLDGLEKHFHESEGDFGIGASYHYTHGDGFPYSNDDNERLSYHKPLSYVLHDGHIAEADTHKVVTAKPKQLAGITKTKTEERYGHEYKGGYASAYGGPKAYAQYASLYHIPLANSVILKAGYIADAQEVHSTKEHHPQTPQATSD